MARIRRVVAVGCPHHLTQRGNIRLDLFFDDEDRQTYLALLAGHAADRHLRLLGYCLISNPIHLIAVPTRADSLSLPMSDARRDDSRWLHIRLHRRGHSWENRFLLDRRREATRDGRPFGGKDFATDLEAKLERVLEPQKRGRKPKHSDQGTEADCASASGLAVSAERG
ncbi:MAG: transposase [Bryobacterales bacterium]|nr:transposase [Bryobacterales bacterium]